MWSALVEVIATAYPFADAEVGPATDGALCATCVTLGVAGRGLDRCRGDGELIVVVVVIVVVVGVDVESELVAVAGVGMAAADVVDEVVARAAFSSLSEHKWSPNTGCP